MGFSCCRPKHDLKICVKGNRFSLTGFQFCGGREYFCSKLLPTTRPRTSVPQKITSKNHSQKFLICPFWSSSLSRSQISVLSGTCTCGFLSCQPLAAVLLQNLWFAALSLPVAAQDPCACCTGSHCPRGWSPVARNTSCGTCL